MKPKVYRQGPGRWYVRVKVLPFDVGPFTEWQQAYRWAYSVGRYWT